jgi:hypothetical protein
VLDWETVLIRDWVISLTLAWFWSILVKLGGNNFLMLFVRHHPIVTVISVSLLGGVVGFVGGIAWCLYDYPGSPQAPLFGIFTCAVGLVLGFIASLAMVFRASLDSSDDKDDQL